jgi:glycosyltransferase involved in cell wall biosynthesis
VSIFTQRRNKNFDSFLSKNVTVIELGTLNFKNHNVMTFLDWFLMFRIPFQIREEFEIVAPVLWQSALGCALMKSLNRKTKVVYHCLEPPRFVYDLRKETLGMVKLWEKILLMGLIPVIKYFDLWAVKKADGIISSSDWTACQIRKIYGLKSEIIYPGVEIKRFKKYTKERARKELKISKAVKLYVSVSKLHRRKRIDQAIEYFQRHLKDVKRKIFYIIGSGPEERKIRELVESKKLENVKILGEVEESMIPVYLNAGDYFIFTAVNEPFGIAPLEATVAGCKVIPRAPRYPVIGWREHALKVLESYEGVRII